MNVMVGNTTAHDPHYFLNRSLVSIGVVTGL